MRRTSRLSREIPGRASQAHLGRGDVRNNRLAVRYHFETTHVTEAPTHLDVRADAPALSMSFNPRDRRNPYLLTWALRGIIEDPQVRELFANELLALREAYEVGAGRGCVRTFWPPW